MELIVPTLGESITEATVSKWLKKVGDSFEADEPLVEIETDKITVEVPAPSAGSILKLMKQLTELIAFLIKMVNQNQEVVASLRKMEMNGLPFVLILPK